MLHRGHKVELRSIEDDDFADTLDEFDLIGFGFPVYAWRAPKFFVKRLQENFPESIDLPAFIFNTRAIASWWANYYIALLLQKKGMEIIDSANFTTPPNDWMALFREDNSLVERHVKFDDDIFDSVEFFSERVIRRVQTGFRHLNLAGNILGIFVSNFGNLLGKGLFWIISKLWSVDKNLCTSCRYCVENCPSGNIEMVQDSRNGKNYPIWNNDCIYCFRCINYCPEEAILLTGLSKGKYRYRLKTGVK